MAFFYFSILCILILDMKIKQKCIKNGKIMGGNENNEEIVIYASTWAVIDLYKLEHEFASWERIPAVGDQVRFEFVCDSDYQIQGGIGGIISMDGLNVKIIKIDFLN